MKKIAISIPNYNRIEELERLINEIIRQVYDYDLTDNVQICVSDDCSPEDPTEVVCRLIQNNPTLDIRYARKHENQGMDYNFRDCVLMAEAEYCWIIGNDDIPTSDALKKVIDFLNNNKDAEFLVTPFDVHDEQGCYRTTVFPFGQCSDFRVDTSINEEKKDLLLKVVHNSGVFGFLSNVVFRRDKWVKNKEKYSDKMQSIFIQMYMNIDTVMSGCVYYYSGTKIIINNADDKTNDSINRICKILVGLDGVVEYFFEGEVKCHFKKVLTDAYINGEIWKLPEDNCFYDLVTSIESEKNTLYKKYYIPESEVKKQLDDCSIVIYGTGDYGNRTYNVLNKNGIVRNIVFADSSSDKVGGYINGCRIISVDEMVNRSKENDAFVIVANHFNLCDMVYLLENRQVDRIGIIC